MNNLKRLSWFIKKILNADIDLNDFDQKLIIQKSVYIAQKMGMEFDYNYGWYVRGVYSSELTVDLYNLNDKHPEYIPIRNDRKILTQILSITPLLEKPSAAFELVSTIIYARKDRNMNDNEAMKFVKTMKPWFSDGEIKLAIEKTNELNIG